MYYDKKLYVVTWKDAWSNSMTYYNEDKSWSPLEVINVGFVMEENDETIVLCSQITPEDSNRHTMVIPWEFIISMEELT